MAIVAWPLTVQPIGGVSGALLGRLGDGSGALGRASGPEAAQLRLDLRLE